jgi:YfiH family protein
VIAVDRGGLAGKADALVTRRPDLALLVAVADCGPVLLHDRKAGVIAAAHAGWRGAVAGVCQTTVHAMRELGATEISAWVGPCIGAGAFEVGEEVADQFPVDCVDRTRDRPHVDLARAIGNFLLEAGLDEGRIRFASQCTFELEDRYWSYRRDGGICGRQFAWIVRQD